MKAGVTLAAFGRAIVGFVGAIALVAVMVWQDGRGGWARPLDYSAMVEKAVGAEAGPVLIRYAAPYESSPEGETVRGATLVCGGVGVNPERSLAAVIAPTRGRRGQVVGFQVTDYAISRPKGRSLSPREAWLLQQCDTIHTSPPP